MPRMYIQDYDHNSVNEITYKSRLCVIRVCNIILFRTTKCQTSPVTIYGELT
jgi:hypothetical protein